MNKVCVVGAGTMGWSIAQVFAQAGWRVTLCDTGLELAQRGKSAMEALLMKRVEAGKEEEARAAEILGNVYPGEYPDAADCRLVVEAIYESLAAKQQLFQTLEGIVGPDAIFASNTSSLSITKIAGILKDPGRMCGMHFFNPATVMKLVEVVKGEQTRPEVMDETTRIAEEIGKTPVHVKESPGFVVNRILIPMINEAVVVLANGVASAEDIDTAMKLGANHPIGPLALGDLVGLDVCLAILEVIYEETGDEKYRPHPYLHKMVDEGKLGRKTGEGFFPYPPR